jgi:hypothetical protein
MDKEQPFKPCPFCGKVASVRRAEHGGKTYFRLGCPDFSCRGHAPYGFPEEDALKETRKWNRRAGDKSMIISFGWTSAAVRARVKRCTRRAWKESHARKFKQGDLVRAFDKDPRCGGREICIIRLTCDPYLEPTCLMPLSDYEAEGFRYLAENPHLVPDSMPYDVSIAGFEAWRQSDATMWVIRFEYA